MAKFDEKTPLYPFGYGRCQCGCNKITQMKSSSSSGDEWVWNSYLDGHEPLEGTADTASPLNDGPSEQNGSNNSEEYPVDFIDSKSPVSSDPVSVSAREFRPTTLHPHISSPGEQATDNLVRVRLTKLFEFLRAYVDLRFPPVRDITQQPRYVWLEDLPAHPSIELFRGEHSEHSGTLLTDWTRSRTSELEAQIGLYQMTLVHLINSVQSRPHLVHESDRFLRRNRSKPGSGDISDENRLHQ